MSLWTRNLFNYCWFLVLCFPDKSLVFWMCAFALSSIFAVRISELLPAQSRGEFLFRHPLANVRVVSSYQREVGLEAECDFSLHLFSCFSRPYSCTSFTLERRVSLLLLETECIYLHLLSKRGMFSVCSSVVWYACTYHLISVHKGTKQGYHTTMCQFQMPAASSF